MTKTVTRSMASGGVLSLARLLTGFVRVKVVALALGVSGVGVYALMVQLYLTGVAVASMSLAVPIINLGRKPVVACDYGEAGSIAGTALAAVLANCLLLAGLAVAFGPSLLGQLGIAAQASGLLLPLAIAVLFGALSGSFWEGMSYLCDRFDAYVRVGIVAAIAEMIFIATAAWAFGLRGAILAMPLGPAAMFLAYALILGRDPIARRVIGHLSLRAAKLRPLLAYSAMMFAAVALTNVGLTLLRSRVLVEAGAAANGYLQAVTSLAAYVLAFVMTGFWGHMHARAAAAGDTEAVRGELDGALRLGLLIAFTGCGAAAVLGDFLIPLFYSGEFRPAAQLLTAYMPGELCFQLLSMLIAYQLTVSLRRAYLALSLGYVILLVGTGLILIPVLGGFGYVAAHNLAAFVMLAIGVALAWRRGQLSRGSLSLSALLILALAAVAVAVFLMRAGGTSAWALLPALLPFAISGCLVLARLVRELRPRPSPTS